MSEQDSYRLSVRFGEEILARGHTAIPNLVLNYYVRLGLSGPELLFTIHVWQHWWSERDPYPSLRTIASRMGISVRQAKRYVESLEQKGFLRVIERFLPDGSQTTNEFDYSALIRAVVAAARADGALGPASSPSIIRRTRERGSPRDISVTPTPDIAVTPPRDSADTPSQPSLATGPLAATSPKEDRMHADQTSKDSAQELAGAPSTAEEAEVLELFSEAKGQTASAGEGAALLQLMQRYAHRAAQAKPPATSAEWVAAAIAEAAQQPNGALTPAALQPYLERWAAGRTVVGATPAQPAAATTGPALAAVWALALAELREQVVPTNYTRWLSRTQLLSRAPGQAVVGVPDRICADQLSRRLDPLVRRALSDACGEQLTISYQVCS